VESPALCVLLVLGVNILDVRVGFVSLVVGGRLFAG